MAKVHGRSFIIINGDTIASKNGASLDLGGVERTAVTTDQGVHHSEKLMPAKIECEVVLREGDSLETYRNLDAGQAQFEADSGQMYVINNVFLTNTLKVQGGDDSSVAMEISGDPAEEV